jgi:hypothetical protein
MGVSESESVSMDFELNMLVNYVSLVMQFLNFYFVMFNQALCIVWIIWRKILIGCNRNWNLLCKVGILCLTYSICSINV